MRTGKSPEPTYLSSSNSRVTCSPRQNDCPILLVTYADFRPVSPFICCHEAADKRAHRPEIGICHQEDRAIVLPRDAGHPGIR